MVPHHSRRAFLTLVAGACLLPVSAPLRATAPATPDAGKDPSKDTQPAPAATAGPLRVLFVGNSYTYVNNLPEMVRLLSLAAKEKRPLEHRSITPGGCTLQKHLDAQGENAPLTVIKKGRWDFVVIQEQSQMPLAGPEQTLACAAKLAAETKAAKATPLFYMTWAREKAPQQQEGLSKVYRAAAKDAGCLLAPVGEAWAKSLAAGGPRLHADDGSHPSPAGTYLAACVFYATLYGRTPVGLPAKLEQKGSNGKTTTLVSLKDTEAAALQKVAWEAAKPAAAAR